MGVPRISVIIPAYNHARYIADAIQSVLRQTHSDFELIIVDDASTDGTIEIVNQFNDPRIISIIHEKNCGPAITRNTAIKASSGEFVSFLDADDFFHPAKLEMHIQFLDQHPDIDVSYNSRFELHYSSTAIRNLVRPPATVGLTDLVLGFPFATSDMVLRREKLMQSGLFEDDLIWSEELELNCKLALSGCRFARIDRALNYRRFESGRRFDNLAAKHQSAIRALEKVFADPRCSPDVLQVHSHAYAIIHMVYGFLALEQNELDFGQRLIRDAVRLNPNLTSGDKCELLLSIVRDSVVDEKQDHEAVTKEMLSRLPVEVEHLSKFSYWAIGQGYILKGCREVLWGSQTEANEYFKQALLCGASLEEFVVEELVYQLLSIQTEFGAPKAVAGLENLKLQLEKLGSRLRVRKMVTDFLAAQAFQYYDTRDYRQIPRVVVRAVGMKPELLLNRGILAIFFRSILLGGV